jgi:hypothetical protein
LKEICRIVAGSRLYGLETPDSDTDTRGVFLCTDPSEIIGLSRRDIIKSGSEDSLFLEFRHYLLQLRKTNSFAMELLFAEGFENIAEEFEVVRLNRLRLIDSERLFSSLMGYIRSERRLANGERTGALGSKRKSQIDKFGFSPKNFSHLLRLAHCGELFFKTSFYPTRIEDRTVRDLIFSVKTEPEKFSIEELNLMSDEAVARLKVAYDRRKESLNFDASLANKLCFDFYFPILMEESK